MFHALCCLLLFYLAIVAQMMGAPFGPVSPHWPALVVVLTARWFSPSVAALWAFVIGLTVDALGAGPLGLHAAILVFIAAGLSRGGGADDGLSAWGWMGAVFFAAWCDALIPIAVELVPARQWQPLEQALLSCTTSAFLAALTAGLIIGMTRQLTRQPRWTGG